MRYIGLLLFCLSIFIGNITSAAISVTERDVDAVLRRLDKELSRRDVYIDRRKAEVDSLKRLLERNDAPDTLKLSVILKIGDNYSAFNADSAVCFFKEGCERARRMQNDSAEIRFALRCATYLPLLTRISGADALMDSIGAVGVPQGLVWEYYDAMRQMASFSSNFFTANPEVYGVYARKHLEAQTNLLEVLDEGSDRYKLNQGELYLMKGEYSRAKAVLLEFIDDIDESHPLYARAAHMLADISKARNDDAGYVYYLALSAISDTRCATLEVTSLQELGRILYSRNDIARAHEYLSVALRNAVDCNVSLRIIQTSQAIPLIERAHRAELASSKRRIYVFIGIMAFMLVLLCVVVMIVKNKNTQLRSMAVTLEDANKTKDLYISQFLNLCSIYMDKLTQFNKVVNRKISAGKVDDLYKLTKSGKFVEEQSKEFYDVFDDAFLHIYPSFVDDVNALLLPDRRIVLKDGEKLNTDLRILALMRLGIEDSARIAQMLNYSVYTIYTYRNKFKSRAANREEFEKKVMEIQSIS